MRVHFPSLIAIISLVVVAACALPRGGPIAAEITGDGNVPEDVLVTAVSRSNVEQLKSWPKSGWHGHYHWFARTPGSKSRIVKTGDLVTLTVWDNQDNSLLLGPADRSVPLRPVEVTEAGTIFVPYVDDIMVAGLTPYQAREKIQALLAPIAPSAQVQIDVEPGASNSVDVVTGVKAPSRLPLSDRNVSVLSVIAQSGGVSESIKNPLVRIHRQGKSYEIPMDGLKKDPSKNVIVRGGDQVIVDEDKRYFIAVGSTQREEQVYFHQETITALESVALLGGLDSARANPQALYILRQYEAAAIKSDGSGPSAAHVIFAFDLTKPDTLFGAKSFLVNPGDIVVASESAVKPAQAVVALIGSLFAIANVFS